MVRAVWVSMYCLILDNIYTLWPAFFILFLMWSLNCSLLSKTMPKYEKLFTNFSWIPLTSSIGSLQSSCAFLLKNMHFVLSRLTDSLFALNKLGEGSAGSVVPPFLTRWLRLLQRGRYYPVLLKGGVATLWCTISINFSHHFKPVLQHV